jgi:hypothetical protein
MKLIGVQLGVSLLSLLMVGWGLVSAQETLPVYVASPSAQTQQGSLCTKLSVASSGRFVPSVTRFEYSTSGAVSGYRFEYGNGVVREFETDTEVTSYTYLQPGTYQPTLWVKNSVGEWETSDACKTELTVQGTPLVGQDTECRGLDINDQPVGSGEEVEANTSIKFTVIGQDNKEPIGQYRVNFGDGSVEEQDNNVFYHTYTTNGNYTVQADVKAAGAEEYADDIGWCTRQLVVGRGTTPTPKPDAQATTSGSVDDLVKQPETGPETWILLASIGLLGTGLVAGFVAKRAHE